MSNKIQLKDVRIEDIDRLDEPTLRRLTKAALEKIAELEEARA